MRPERLDPLILFSAAAVFLGLWIALRPPMYLASDEAGNLALAYVLQGGTPFADVAGRQLPEAVDVAGHQVSRYPPGLAALLLPFTWLGPEAAFLLPLAAHLAVFAVLAWLLRRAGVSPLWALLWLCYPTAVLHSRTLMSNLPEALFLLGAFALLVRGGRRAAVAAGLVLGLGLLVRPMIAVGAAVLVVGALWRQRREILAGSSLPAALLRSDAALSALGALPGLLLFLAYNWWAFGSPLDCGYVRVGNQGLFSLGALASILPLYAFFLLLFYPLMLLAPPGWRGMWKLEIVMVPSAYLLFYGAYGWFDPVGAIHDWKDGRGLLSQVAHGGLAGGPSLPEIAVRSLRFLLPAVPFLLLAYARVVSERLRPLPGIERRALIAVLVGGLVGAGFLSHRHRQAQRQAAAARDALYARTEEGAMLVAGIEATKMLQDVWGRRRVSDFSDTNTEPLKAWVAAGRPAYLVTLAKPGRETMASWDQAKREEMKKSFRLSGGESPTGDWMLGIWRLGVRE